MGSKMAERLIDIGSFDGNIQKLVKRAIKNRKGKKITVEVDNLNQLKKIIDLKFKRILFHD